MLRLALSSFVVAVIGSVALFGCTGPGGFGDRQSIGVGGGAATGAGVGSGSGSGQGGAGATSGVTGATSGAGVTSGTGTPVEAAFAFSVDDTSPGLDLDDAVDLTVTVTADGDVGTVTLGVEDLPDGVDAIVSPDTLLVGAAGVHTATVTLSTRSWAPPGDHPFTLRATSSTQSETVDGVLAVAPVITIVIPQGVLDLGGTLGNPYKTAYGPYPIEITAPSDIGAEPVTVFVYNDDDLPHEIHSDQGDVGFPHDADAIPPNAMDPVVRELHQTGTYDFYLHDQGGAATPGRIVIQ